MVCIPSIVFAIPVITVVITVVISVVVVFVVSVVSSSVIPIIAMIIVFVVSVVISVIVVSIVFTDPDFVVGFARAVVAIAIGQFFLDYLFDDARSGPDTASLGARTIGVRVLAELRLKLPAPHSVSRIAFPLTWHLLAHILLHNINRRLHL